jgi:hypothetical protein
VKRPWDDKVERGLKARGILKPVGMKLVNRTLVGKDSDFVRGRELSLEAKKEGEPRSSSHLGAKNSALKLRYNHTAIHMADSEAAERTGSQNETLSTKLSKAKTLAPARAGRKGAASLPRATQPRRGTGIFNNLIFDHHALALPPAIEESMRSK